MPKILGGDTIALSTILVLWPELPDTLPGKPLYGHFLLLAFPFNFNTSAKAPHSILCARTKPRWYARMTNSRVGLLLWHTSSPTAQDREGERFWSCVASSDVIFVMQLLWAMKKSWPSNKIRLFMMWEERDNYKAWNQKDLLQKLKTCVSFHYSVFPFNFFLYLLKKVKILLITD